MKKYGLELALSCLLYQGLPVLLGALGSRKLVRPPHHEIDLAVSLRPFGSDFGMEPKRIRQNNLLATTDGCPIPKTSSGSHQALLRLMTYTYIHTYIRTYIHTHTHLLYTYLYMHI